MSCTLGFGLQFPAPGELRAFAVRTPTHSMESLVLFPPTPAAHSVQSQASHHSQLLPISPIYTTQLCLYQPNSPMSRPIFSHSGNGVIVDELSSSETPAQMSLLSSVNFSQVYLLCVRHFSHHIQGSQSISRHKSQCEDIRISV